MSESNLTESLEKYPKSLRLIHWTAFALFLMLFVSGPIMVDLDKADPFRRELMGWHKSVGVVALLVLALRLAVRLRTALPALPESFKAWELGLAHWGHRLIYLLMIVIPFTGWADSNFHGRPVKLFGLPLPTLFPTIEGIGTTPGLVHTILSYSLLGLVGLHVAGVIKHRFIDRADVLHRML